MTSSFALALPPTKVANNAKSAFADFALLAAVCDRNRAEVSSACVSVKTQPQAVLVRSQYSYPELLRNMFD